MTCCSRCSRAAYLRAPRRSPHSYAWSPGGRYLAVTLHDQVKVFDRRTGATGSIPASRPAVADVDGVTRPPCAVGRLR